MIGEYCNKKKRASRQQGAEGAGTVDGADAECGETLDCHVYCLPCLVAHTRPFLCPPLSLFSPPSITHTALSQSTPFSALATRFSPLQVFSATALAVFRLFCCWCLFFFVIFFLPFLTLSVLQNALQDNTQSTGELWSSQICSARRR